MVLMDVGDANNVRKDGEGAKLIFAKERGVGVVRSWH